MRTPSSGTIGVPFVRRAQASVTWPVPSASQGGSEKPMRFFPVTQEARSSGDDGRRSVADRACRQRDDRRRAARRSGATRRPSPGRSHRRPRPRRGGREGRLAPRALQSRQPLTRSLQNGHQPFFFTGGAGVGEFGGGGGGGGASRRGSRAASSARSFAVSLRWKCLGPLASAVRNGRLSS